MEGTCFLLRPFHKRFKMLQIEYIWKPALLVLEANMFHLYTYAFYSQHIFGSRLCWLCIYIYMTRVPHATHVFCIEHIYVYMHSKHVSKLTSFIFYLYDILSAGGIYIYITYSMCILISFTYSMCVVYAIH